MSNAGFIVLFILLKNGLVVLDKEVRVAREGLVVYNAIACERLNAYKLLFLCHQEALNQLVY